MNNYINNKEFLQQLKDYYDLPDPKPQIPNSIGKKFILIATNILNKVQCINFTKDRKDEIISRMLFYMCTYIGRFDPYIKTSPFAYFSEVAWSHFLQYCKLQKKHQERFINLSFIENLDKDFEIENYNED